MSIYREKNKDGTFKTGIWMLKVYVDGKPIRRSTGTTNEKKARKIEAAATTDTGRGVPTEAAIGKLRFDQAAALIKADYEHNEYDTLESMQGRIDNHLEPFFGARTKMTTIDDTRINAYIAERRNADAKNSTINRELGVLKRMFTLGVRAKRLVYAPFIPELMERNIRKGFFEEEAFYNVRAHLPLALQGVATVAYITGWRVDSEILTQEWRHVDFAGNELQLDAELAKNEEPRTFPMTAELREVYDTQHAAAKALAATGTLFPRVFFRMVAKGRRGLSPQHKAYAAVVATPKAIKRFDKAWKTACERAGCPQMLKHDFRRTAVRNMVRRGIPEAVAMQMCGHKTRAVFERYNIVSPADLKAARAALEGLSGGGVNLMTGSKTGSFTILTDPAASRMTKSLRKFGGAARI